MLHSRHCRQSWRPGVIVTVGSGTRVTALNHEDFDDETALMAAQALQTVLSRRTHRKKVLGRNASCLDSWVRHWVCPGCANSSKSTAPRTPGRRGTLRCHLVLAVRKLQTQGSPSPGMVRPQGTGLGRPAIKSAPGGTLLSVLTPVPLLQVQPGNHHRQSNHGGRTDHLPTITATNTSDSGGDRKIRLLRRDVFVAFFIARSQSTNAMPISKAPTQAAPAIPCQDGHCQPS